MLNKICTHLYILLCPVMLTILHWPSLHWKSPELATVSIQSLAMFSMFQIGRHETTTEYMTWRMARSKEIHSIHLALVHIKILLKLDLFLRIYQYISMSLQSGRGLLTHRFHPTQYACNNKDAIMSKRPCHFHLIMTLLIMLCVSWIFKSYPGIHRQNIGFLRELY